MTVTEPMLQDGSPPPPSHRRGLRAVIAVLIVVLLVIAVLAVIVYRNSRHYYTLAPGTAPVVSAAADCRPVGGGNYALPGGQPCVKLELPSGQVHAVNGSIMMVDVLVGPTTPWDYVESKLGWLGRGDQLEPASAILGTTPASQLDCQNTQDMTDSTSLAAVVSLRRLGYHVDEDDLGAQIDEVAPNTPAAAAGLQCNDLVTAVDAKPVTTDTALVAAIHALKPGDTARVTVTRTGSGAPRSVTLTAKLSGTPAQPGAAANPAQAFLGVQSETRFTYRFPFGVSIQVGQIGGPSAGLALTLGMLDALSNGQLTGGHHIAATGTIDLQGDVGDVGGVAQKTVAVRDAGATAFLVPVQEYATARRAAGSMKVYAVSTLQQALGVLQSLGGEIPPASATGSS